MNIRLAKDYNLLASVYWDEEIMSNYYSISLGMLTNSESSSEQNIAFGRVASYIGDILQSGVFISQSEKEQIHQLQNAKMKTIILPERPFDQSVAIMLFCKLNAICEDKLLITDITVTSSLSDNVRYMIDAEDQFGPFGEDGWWHESNPDWFDHTIGEDNTKVIKMDERLTWENVNLNWEEKEEKEESINNVVKGNFNKQDD